MPVSFSTETGAFDESWSSTLSATAADLVSLHQDFDPTALTGTYDVKTDVTSTDYDSLSTWLDARA